MITVHSTEEARPFLASGCCLTIGNFDGLHMGHRRLLARTRERAEDRGLPCAVLCFHPHPVQVLAPGHVPPLLAGRAQRLRLLAGQGADLCLELPFTPEFAALSPEDFVRGTLAPLGVRELIVGYDFSLGRKRSGNAETLAALGRVYGFGVEQIAPVILRDAVVSSTRVRDLVLAGRVWEARELLGRFHSICGPVVRGEGRGRSLGFPTANLALPENVLPGDGVYATEAGFGGIRRPAVTNIGVKPTFGVFARGVETFIPDIEVDLYGGELEIFFVQRLRDEERFADPEALRRRIERDVELARRVPDPRGLSPCM
jgi:riboflavin kinase/FMN adenylyltransferase